jgi:ABC-type nitrate/sulfonate/bicarbonate transport system permease component
MTTHDLPSPRSAARPRRTTAVTQVARRSIWRVLGVVLAVTVWEAAAGRVADAAVLPAPGLVVRDLIDNFGGSPALAYLGLSETSYLGNLQYTGTIVLSAWAVGSLIGIVAGVAAGRLQWVRDLVEPVLYVFGVVPVLVAAPFFLIWFGFGPAGQWALVAFFSAVVVAVVAQTASLTMPPRYEEYAATLGIPGHTRLRRVVLPMTMPANIGGLRAALAAAWGLQVVAELMGSRAGMGRAISVRADTGDVASVLALILTLGVVAVLADVLLTQLLKGVMSWQ